MAGLLQEFQTKIHTAHYVLNTERTYCYWIKRFILFHQKHHSKEMIEVGYFLVVSSFYTAHHLLLPNAANPKSNTINLTLYRLVNAALLSQ
jgi:hypothetical protein